MKIINKKNITHKYKKNQVYDLKIKNNHNYYITKSNILVHNSGKSYVLKRISSGSIEPRIVNTDTWTEYYMKFDPNVDWKKYGSKIKTLTKAQLINYFNSLLPLWIDGTSSNPASVLRRKGILQSVGYDTAMIFVDTPVETAVQRNKERDRIVDEDFLKTAYKESQRLKSYYATEFGNNFTEILNGEGELTNKVIINAYRKMNNFFNSEITNPIGSKIKKEMIDNGWKYLIEHPDFNKKYIKKLVDNWYRK